MGQHTLQKNYEPVSIGGLVCRCVMLCQHEIGRMTWNLLLEITSTIFTVPLFALSLIHILIMKINWKVRLKNKTFVIAFSTAVVAFIYQLLALLGITPALSLIHI